ncbi:MAG TPA: hypothetical protein VF756_27385 [Thermoanaerobaculia bacterium]
MTDDVIAPSKSHDLAAETNAFQNYLAHYGLPTENIIASTEERRIVGENLPSFLNSLAPDEKQEARYLSKFVGSTAIGLFDAALNYVWNEVVLNLRKKVIVYGVDLFFDAAVGGSARASYKDEEDLPGLKDSVLLDTCRKLELISDVVYIKLSHILTMRNEVAASHPNVERIGGFELLGWLQTCVRDVLQDQPSESAIRIKALVANLKASTNLLDQQTVARFATEARNLSMPHLKNLVLTIFGICCAPDTGSILRGNILQLAPHIWTHAPDTIKYRVGIIIDGYRTNLQNDRLTLGIGFLAAVGGLRYETIPARTVALTTLTARLEQAHQGHDNYWHEPPIMEEILRYCANVDDIPEPVLPTLTRAVVRCRLGRGLSYRNGVSPGGAPLYDRYLSMLNEAGVVHAIVSLFEPTINARLRNPICQEHLVAILRTLSTRAISDRLRAVVNYLLADVKTAWSAGTRKDFRELASPYIRFS